MVHNDLRGTNMSEINQTTKSILLTSENTLDLMNICEHEPDNINPNHYKKGKIECIHAIESATVGKTGIEAVCVANVIKYLWRYEEKNGLEDVKKAQWYLNKLIETLEEEQC